MTSHPHALALALALAISPTLVSAAEWSYEGAHGPEHWAELNPGYAGCAGKNQSPVDLSGFVEAELPPLVFDYQLPAMTVTNNGHTVQVNIAEGNAITVDGQRFALRQFHAHAPSENTLEGKSFPLEVHFVHADASGNLAVVAVFFKEGAENSSLEAAWNPMPAVDSSRSVKPGAKFFDTLLPSSRDYFRFSGSLTTPPCTEGVRWLVMKNPVTASARQIEALRHAVGHANNRPVQPVNARLILR